MTRSTVVTWKPPATPGAAITQPRWLGHLGPVRNLVYSYKVSGGPDAMSCVLNVPPDYRTDAMDHGRVVQIYRGGVCIWDGKLLEAVPGSISSGGGWQISATGLGNSPQDFLAIYTTWTNQNDAVNQAINRGLRVSNPGISSGVWLGQQIDSGGQSIAALLDLFCTLGGFYWYISVNPTGGGGILNVNTFPQGLNGPQSPLVANRLLTITVPVARNLGNGVNTVYMRYQSSANNTAAPTFAVTSQQNALQAAKYQPIEVFEDISSAQHQTAAAVQALENQVLNRFIPVSYSGPFLIRPGELLTTGGTAIDPGTDQAGTICQALVTDFAHGGDVVPGPITFMTGNYQWDDEAQIASITPFQSLDTSFSSMLGAVSAVASGAFRSSTGKTGFWGYGTAGEERAWLRAHRPKPERHKRRPKPPVPSSHAHGQGSGPPVKSHRPKPSSHAHGQGSGPPVPPPHHAHPRPEPGHSKGTGSGPPVPGPGRQKLTQHDIDWVHGAEETKPDPRDI